MKIIEKRLTVNPIIISLEPSVNRVEYAVLKEGIRMIYALKTEPGSSPEEQFGIFDQCVYKPKGEVISKTREDISNNDTYIKDILRSLKRKYGFYCEYTQSRFYGINFSCKHELWVQTTKFMGYVESYICTPKSEVKFGPLIEVAISSKKLSTFVDFVNELKSQLRRLYSTPQIFQLREKDFTILRKL